MDLKNLIAGRAAINSAAKSIRLDSSISNQASEELKAVSKVSEHARHWQFVVAASGYLEAFGESAMITVPQVLEKIREEPAQARLYFDSVTTLPVDDVFAAGIEVAEIFGPTEVNVMAAVSQVALCYELCNDQPDTQKAQCLKRCLRQGMISETGLISEAT